MGNQRRGGRAPNPEPGREPGPVIGRRIRCGIPGSVSPPVVTAAPHRETLQATRKPPGGKPPGDLVKKGRAKAPRFGGATSATGAVYILRPLEQERVVRFLLTELASKILQATVSVLSHPGLELTQHGREVRDPVLQQRRRHLDHGRACQEGLGGIAPRVDAARHGEIGADAPVEKGRPAQREPELRRRTVDHLAVQALPLGIDIRL
jgi:hypothetical protein